MNKIKTIYLDAGHSGIDKFGRYLTAPSKQFKHEGLTLHKDGWFFEGVSNRAYADIIEPMLIKAGFNVIRTFNPILDTTLQERVNVANRHQRTLNRATDAGLFLSLHSNAHNGIARGFSAHTSIGTTFSDTIAKAIREGYMKDVSSKWKTRVFSLKDDNFFVLKNTNMPAVLLENLFFDNRDDVQIILNASYREDYCRMIVEVLKGFM